MIAAALALAMMFPNFEPGTVTFQTFDTAIVDGRRVNIRDDRLTYCVYLKYDKIEPWPVIPWMVCRTSPCRFPSLRLPTGGVEYSSVTAHRLGVGEGPH